MLYFSAMTVPPVAPYKALENFSKALYGTTGGTYSARVFRPVMAWIASQQSLMVFNYLEDYMAYHRL